MSDTSMTNIERFDESEPCDEPGCDETPTAWVGDIYYACSEHVNVFEELVR